MRYSEEMNLMLMKLFHVQAEEKHQGNEYRDLCVYMRVARMYYDMDLGGDGRYRNQRTQKLVMAEDERGDKLYLYDNGKESDIKLVFPYYYEGAEYVHAYLELEKGVRREELNMALYQYLADIIYLLESRKNMRKMLDFAEVTDMQTGIPNAIYIRMKYEHVVKSISPDELLVLYINLQNFKFINQAANSRSGDEAIIQYAHYIMQVVSEDECVCRMGGDNFVMFIHKNHLDNIINKLNSVSITQLKSAPSQAFEVSAWIGISQLQPGENRPFGARLDEAATACHMGKTRLKKNLVYFTEELSKLMGRSREIIAMFHPAVKNQEFVPFFQAKVDMRTGELVGFEALCRWVHEGRLIYPDQFVPVLDKEGLIHELDIAIFRAVCMSIRRWKDMRLNPPRVSSNFSRKNLYVPGIEEKIVDIIRENGIEPGDIEIEITESVQESEYNRLIDFIRRLKAQGLYIAVDDFGTGYSSLSLIHNIEADVIKIDKSFIDEISSDKKSRILIESIISIASHLDMSIIAEGVETADQGRTLMQMGCNYAQGYFYSKPADFNVTTQLIQSTDFQPIC